MKAQGGLRGVLQEGRGRSEVLEEGTSHGAALGAGSCGCTAQPFHRGTAAWPRKSLVSTRRLGFFILKLSDCTLGLLRFPSVLRLGINQGRYTQLNRL